MNGFIGAVLICFVLFCYAKLMNYISKKAVGEAQVSPNIIDAPPLQPPSSPPRMLTQEETKQISLFDFVKKQSMIWRCAHCKAVYVKEGNDFKCISKDTFFGIKQCSELATLNGDLDCELEVIE